MLKLCSIPLAAILLAALPLVATAVTVDVLVEDNVFIPNDVTINVGDTVRWTNAPGGAPHTVTADDFSFASVTASSFTFSRTFNSAAEILYFCEVHSSPGRNRDTNMNGRVVVKEASAPPFLINSAISDAWFFPGTNGQGFFIIVWEGSKFVFLSWFTYDTQRPPADVMAMLGEPGHRWLTAQGPYDGDTATLDVFVSSGGTFDSPDPEVTAVQDGTITIVWTGCNAGILTYNIPSLGLTGEIAIERIVLDNVPACEAAQPPQ